MRLASRGETHHHPRFVRHQPRICFGEVDQRSERRPGRELLSHGHSAPADGRLADPPRRSLVMQLGTHRQLAVSGDHSGQRVLGQTGINGLETHLGQAGGDP